MSSKSLKDIFWRTPTGVWQPRDDNVLYNLIRIQSVAGRRNLTPVHFWRYNAEKIDYDSTYREPKKKTYYDPVTALLFIGHGAPVKKLERSGVEDEFDHEFKIDLAEAIRLGELFGTDDPDLEFKFFLPGPNDLYQWNDSLYEVQDVKASDFYKLVDRFVVWTGEAKLHRGDSASPPEPLPYVPKLGEPLWAL